MGCFELLVLLGIVIIIARLDALRGHRDSRRLGNLFGRLFRRLRRVSGRQWLLFGLLFGFVFLITVLSSSMGSTEAIILLLVGLLYIAVPCLIVWGAIRLYRLLYADSRPGICPPIHLLKDFLSEHLPSAERARLAAHLEVCTACQHRVEGLTAGQKSWPGMARKLSVSPPSPEPALRKVMDRLKENDAEATGDEPVFCGDLPLGFLSPTDKPDQLGRLERYEVLSEIGRGGMGVVLKAFDPSLHRVVAIKVLAPQLATSGVARKRFLREAKAAAAVTHDHIVTIHAVDEANGLPYLVMQYVAGMSLQERIDKDGPLDLADILRIGMQTASGLAAAHGHGIVHRDIKPANILLEEGVQRVKITDFGLARAMDDASLTQSGFVAGSPLYMAPEQARGEALDHRADLFSLGSVLYTMCTGRPPFRAANTLAVLRRVSEDTPRPIRETNPEIPDWLADVVAKLLSKEPAERYQSAAEVVEVLGQHLAQLQQAAWVPPPRPPAPAAPIGDNAGLPTSLTICPSCGANLHVPERMVGSLVHCAECGKPFQVEQGSEVMQVARPAQWPLRPRFRLRRLFRGCLWIVAGFVVLAMLLIFVYQLGHRLFGPQGISTPAALKPPGGPSQRWRPPLERWGQLHGLPPTATLFGAIEFMPARNFLTLDDEQTQTLLRLFLPKETAKRITSENLGRIYINGVGLACYASPQGEDALALLHLAGTAQEGRKRIVDYVRRASQAKVMVEGEDKGPPMGSIHLSSRDFPFALKIVDDHHAYLAACWNPQNQAPELSKIQKQVPSSVDVLSGYNPPWIKNALINIPQDACGFLLGEIPDSWKNVWTDALNIRLRVHPRSFVCHVKKELQGVTFFLTLNVDKSKAEGMELRDELVLWCRQALDVLQQKYSALGKEREARAAIGQILQSMHWEIDIRDGSIHTEVHVSTQDWKVLSEALIRMSPMNNSRP